MDNSSRYIKLNFVHVFLQCENLHNSRVPALWGFLCNCLKKSFCCFFVCLSTTICRGVISLVFTSIISGVHRVYVVYIHGFGVQQTHQSSLVFTEHVVYMGLGATDDSFLDTPFRSHCTLLIFLSEVEK
jgi:hypothetical protein